MREFDDEFKLKIIFDRIEEIEYWTAKITKEQFINNRMIQSACSKYLMDIFNACHDLSDEIKENKNISWSEMRKMRDRLSHQYFGIQYSIVWETIQNDIPVLKQELNIYNREV